jgi:ribosomal protein S18 acetylase RimI-like enzyme
LTIQPAGPEHVEEIAALAALIWRAHYPEIISPAQIEYMLARMYALDTLRAELAGGIYYGRLLLAGTLAGFSAWGPSGRAGEAKLHKLYVHPARQRQGLGSALLRHVEAKVRDRDFRVLILAVNKGNAAAIAAYRRHGFTVRESVVVDIGGGFVMDDYVMEKGLF